MKTTKSLDELRKELLKKQEEIARDLRHLDGLMASHCGWVPPPEPTDKPALTIAYNKEARDYIEEIDLIWSDTREVTSADFIEWLKKKFTADAVRENSARGAIVAMAEEGVLKVKTEGRGRIGSTYTVAQK